MEIIKDPHQGNDPPVSAEQTKRRIFPSLCRTINSLRMINECPRNTGSYCALIESPF